MQKVRQYCCSGFPEPPKRDFQREREREKEREREWGRFHVKSVTGWVKVGARAQSVLYSALPSALDIEARISPWLEVINFPAEVSCLCLCLYWPRLEKCGKGLRAGVCLPKWKSKVAKVGEWGITGFSPMKFWEKLGVGVDSSCASILLSEICLDRSSAPGSVVQETLKFVSLRIALAGGLDYLFPLRNTTLGFLPAHCRYQRYYGLAEDTGFAVRDFLFRIFC